MVLATKKLLIVVQLPRDADLMASGAELGGAHERFEEGFLVKLGLSLDQLLIDVLQQTIGAVGERVVDRLVNGIVCIASGGVDVRDRVAGGAGDAGLGGRMIDVIKLGVIEGAAEERDDI